MWEALIKNMGCTHNYFEYEVPIHYAEFNACLLSGAFPACQYMAHHWDKFEEDFKKYRKDGIMEEAKEFACGVANPDVHKNARVDPEM